MSGTALDPRNAPRAISAVAKALGISGVGPHRLRHATRMLAAGVLLHTVSELLGHSCVAVTGGVYGHPPRRVCPPPSSGSQEQWVGENVCRGYTNGYTAAKRPPRILSETASDLLFPVGMTVFWFTTSRTGVSRHPGVMSREIPDSAVLRAESAGHDIYPFADHRDGGREPSRP